MGEYYVERVVPAIGRDALAVMDAGGNVVRLFDYEQRLKAELLAEDLNTAWRDGHAKGVASVARPRLAPEHVAWLGSIAECSEYGMKSYEELIQEADQGADLRHIKESVDSYRRDVDAIRAALAALGEE